MFEPTRLVNARHRLGFTATALAKAIGVSTQSIHNYERDRQSPSSDTMAKLADVLGLPPTYFERGPIEELPDHAVSFRARTRMAARVRNSALAMSQIGVDLRRALSVRFHVPRVDVPTPEREMTPELAAAYVRSRWGIDERRPMPNMVHLLEAHGIAVFSLPAWNTTLDAFAFWSHGQPFVYLNTAKSAERGRFDAAHELGHLVLHHSEGAISDPEAEKQANQFAASLLLPRQGVRARVRMNPTTADILSEKHYWSVAAMALRSGLHELSLLSVWGYRRTVVDLGRLGYRSAEPDGIARERSLLFAKAYSSSRGKRLVRDLAEDVGVTPGIVGDLSFGLAPTLLDAAPDDGPRVAPVPSGDYPPLRGVAQLRP